MAEIIQGSAEDKLAWANQMRGIHEYFPQALATGRFGRMAMYAAYEHPVEPVNLRHTPEELAAKDIEPEYPSDWLRDIDLLGAPYYLGDKFDLLKPHPVDQGMDIYVRRDPEDPANLVLFGMDQDEEELWIASHAELLTPRMRMLDGIPVNTPLVGVQQQIERIVGTGILPPERQAVYDAGRVAFDAFVDSVRATAPEEFLPEEIMAPLVAFAELNAY